MSTPLEGLAIYYTADRLHLARRLMAEYHKQALEEVDQIQTFERQRQQSQQKHVAPLRPATPKGPHTHAPIAAETATPHKPGMNLKGLFRPSPKKKDESTGVRPPMGPERLSPPGIRTADLSAGGQMPEEDSWDWYERSILALRPVPLPVLPVPSQSATYPALRERVQD